MEEWLILFGFVFALMATVSLGVQAPFWLMSWLWEWRHETSKPKSKLTEDWGWFQWIPFVVMVGFIGVVIVNSFELFI